MEPTSLSLERASRPPALDVETMQVALVIPLQGPEGIFGPSCEACAELAVEEINSGAGVLGRELRLVVVDGGAKPQRVADELDVLTSAGAIDAVTGWHISAVREVVAPRIASRIPYVYTPLYEGGERTPGVFLTGETPGRQLLPSLRWMTEELGVRRWCVVGDDYVWPRGSAAAAHRYARRCGVHICDEIYVGLGTDDFAEPLRRIERSGAQGVLMFLVGNDAVRFNRAFARAGLDSSLVRLSPLMEENMLVASGADATRGIYTASGFFPAAATPETLDFVGRYTAHFGPEAPLLNSMGESCYEGVRLLSALTRQAEGFGVGELCSVADSVAYGGPRGEVRLSGHHLDQRIYLAKADGMQFDVLAELSPMSP
ncbi:amino acid/amide ABC transporter substrate-binding protein, HAAT family [Haloechinothrix alba]|uniref:Amino acid/amide ABC transporter substrate-binding protein, HAAT family n=1 Tax=Haloechinothrix alba TaxID=664784 RepID=A0A238Z1Q1_9PSEU|nr:substrate-binding domain-containing protein [Haloechinothrix alba]SNR76773.1 amino acid/amide ABC transporter substrate-binding protein, HAAT family [Haloechinothrix alba]